MNEKSPFEQWREHHLYQIAVSPEILKLIAEAFQGGRLYEMQPLQKQEWVVLTDKEAQETFAKHNCTISADLAGILARAIGAKLKERNK